MGEHDSVGLYAPPATLVAPESRLLRNSVFSEPVARREWRYRELHAISRVGKRNYKSETIMTWNRKLPKSLHLNDGRTLTTLANARDMLLQLPRDDLSQPDWMSAGELLLQAAYRGRKTPIVDVGAEFSRALQRHGMI